MTKRTKWQNKEERKFPIQWSLIVKHKSHTTLSIQPFPAAVWQWEVGSFISQFHAIYKDVCSVRASMEYDEKTVVQRERMHRRTSTRERRSGRIRLTMNIKNYIYKHKKNKNEIYECGDNGHKKCFARFRSP